MPRRRAATETYRRPPDRGCGRIASETCAARAWTRSTIAGSSGLPETSCSKTAAASASRSSGSSRLAGGTVGELALTPPLSAGERIGSS